MNGHIVDYDNERRQGTLRNDNGIRYTFIAAEFLSHKTPSAGMAVHFDVTDGVAVDISFLGMDDDRTRNDFSAFDDGDPDKTVALTREQVAAAAMGKPAVSVEETKPGGAGIVGKTKNAISNVGQQIMHGDPNVSVAMEAAQAKTALPVQVVKKVEKPSAKMVKRPDPIVECTDCGGKISSRAKTCPDCGGPVPKCKACGTPLDLSVEQCGSCGAEAKISIFTKAVGDRGVTCPDCYADAYRKTTSGCLSLFLIIIMWPWFLFVWALSYVAGKPDFMKPEYSCSRCDNIFRVDR